MHFLSTLAMLRPPAVAADDADVARLLPSWPHVVEAAGQARWPGPTGGLVALSSLERAPFVRLYARALPPSGGLEAAYAADTVTGSLFVVVVSGHPAPYPEGCVDLSEQVCKAHMEIMILLAQSPSRVFIHIISYIGGGFGPACPLARGLCQTVSHPGFHSVHSNRNCTQKSLG